MFFFIFFEGICNERDWVIGLFKACLIVEAFPITQQTLSLAPVEYVADGVVAPLKYEQFGKGEVVHLANQEKFSYKQFFEALERASGKKFEALPFGRFIEKVRRKAMTEPKHDAVLAPTILILGRLDDFPPEQQYDTTNAKKCLADFRHLDKEYFDAVAKYLM